MTSQEQLAREWADRIMTTTLERIDPVQRAAAEYILANTKPETMDKVMWKNGTHSLTGAEFYNDGEPVDVVMLACQPDGYIDYATLDGKVRDEARSEFTPNGKRYELREVGEHPDTLTSPADYIAAPAGTIVTNSDAWPMVKDRDGSWYEPGYVERYPSKEMMGRGDVLRWGWGA